MTQNPFEASRNSTAKEVSQQHATRLWRIPTL